MTKMRFPGAAPLMAVLVSAVLVGCVTVEGDRDVDTSPPGDEVGKYPGLFTGKKGALIFEFDPWWGSSPSGDAEE